MNHYLESVAKFHKTFKSPILDSPQIPVLGRQLFRISLLEEELNELKNAIAENNLVEVADAFADLQYVLSGAILEFGLGDKFDKIFNEVQRSNMSKACKTEEEANNTVNRYNQNGIETDYEESEGQWLIFRTSDRKTLKSINYSPANIEEILNPTIF